MSDKAAAWDSLRSELDRWAESGMTATVWWRDDDACAETTHLQRLDELSRQTGIPVSIAVIPARLEPSLSGYLRGKDNFSVLQHGYAHKSFAAPGVKKIEMGGVRCSDDVIAELRSGHSLLRHAFPDQLVDVLVPPWNRIDPHIVSRLAANGYSGVSSMWARRHRYPVDGLLEVNTHMDPVNWRFGGGFMGEYRAVSQIRRHLFARRNAFQDTDEPTGILTHHLVQDDAVWQFCRSLMLLLQKHPAVRWLDARDIWGTPVSL